jgi:hypothetical protein
MLRWFALVFAVLCVWVAPAAAQAPKAECTTLSCANCTSVCTATCDAEFKVCTASKSRGCPRAYRSCTRGCTSQLCAQCLPIQYGSDGKTFMPGKTQLCRTPGSFETKKG